MIRFHLLDLFPSLVKFIALFFFNYILSFLKAVKSVLLKLNTQIIQSSPSLPQVEEIRREQQNAKLNKSASNTSAMQQQTPLQTTTKFSPTHHQSPERKRPKSSSDSDGE